MHPPELRHDVADALPVLAVPWEPSLPPAPAPFPDAPSQPYAAGIVELNEGLAAELGLDVEWLRSPEGVAVLGARAVPTGARPVAQAYAGHQFGGFSPVLGDGRAVLLGELAPPSVGGDQAGGGDEPGGDRPGGDRHLLRDLALKGSGRTVFSRGGDGRAVLGPVLREHLFGEALHALNIPTTRALASSTTGDLVSRDATMRPGAVLARVAASHLRVGTVELVARSLPPDRRLDTLGALTAYAIERHHPHVDPADALGLLEAVVEAHARLTAQWLAVGFVHGVMNTDNTTLSGETIDFGPCAWLDAWDEDAVFSSIDTGGRYRFGAQPDLAGWNLARLGECLLPLVPGAPDDALAAASEVVASFRVRHRLHLLELRRAKLALPGPGAADDAALVDDLLAIMAAERADATATWHVLAASLTDPAVLPEPYVAWHRRWVTRLAGADARPVAAAMAQVNPVYVPRNHLVDGAIDAAYEGDLGPFRRLLAAVSRPYAARPGLVVDPELAVGAPAGFTAGFVTYCGT